MWIFEFSPGVCPIESGNLVFSHECLVSNGRRALLGGIRLGGSATATMQDVHVPSAGLGSSSQVPTGSIGIAYEDEDEDKDDDEVDLRHEELGPS